MIDTTTPSGKMVLHVFGSMAQLDWDLISERTKAGLESAKHRDRKGGRPISFSPEQRDIALNMRLPEITHCSYCKSFKSKLPDDLSGDEA